MSPSHHHADRQRDGQPSETLSWHWFPNENDFYFVWSFTVSQKCCMNVQNSEKEKQQVNKKYSIYIIFFTITNYFITIIAPLKNCSKIISFFYSH